MAVAGKRCIRVGRVDELDGKNVLIEAQALEVIKPGFLIHHDPVAGPGFRIETTPAASAGGRLTVANKDELRGGSVDDDWQIGDLVQGVHFAPRDIANVMAEPDTYVFGDRMVRTLNGTLRKQGAVATEPVVAYCDEDITTTAQALVRVHVA